MLSQREHQEKRQKLIDSTIQLVAERGIGDISTKNIGLVSGINEAYIYRYFESKEDLLVKAFSYVDNGFLGMILENHPILQYESVEYEERCRLLFNACWRFIRSHPRKLVFYVRYYYFAFFEKYSAQEHERRYAVLMEKMQPAFPDSVSVSMLLHYILDNLLGMAVKHLNDPEEKAEETAEACFRLIFAVVRACIKEEKIHKPEGEKA